MDPKPQPQTPNPETLNSVEWRKLVKEEEKRTRREAERIRKEYLFGGHTQKEAKQLREQAESAFEGKTSDLGRSKTKEHQQTEAGATAESAGGDLDWMKTLKAVMAHPGTPHPTGVPRS